MSPVRCGRGGTPRISSGTANRHQTPGEFYKGKYLSCTGRSKRPCLPFRVREPAGVPKRVPVVSSPGRPTYLRGAGRAPRDTTTRGRAEEVFGGGSHPAPAPPHPPRVGLPVTPAGDQDKQISDPDFRTYRVVCPGRDGHCPPSTPHPSGARRGRGWAPT